MVPAGYTRFRVPRSLDCARMARRGRTEQTRGRHCSNPTRARACIEFASSALRATGVVLVWACAVGCEPRARSSVVATQPAPSHVAAPGAASATSYETAVTLSPTVAQCAGRWSSPDRRLSRFELANAVGDVFGVDASSLRGLPPPRRSIGDTPDILVGRSLDFGDDFSKAYEPLVDALLPKIAPRIANLCQGAKAGEQCVFAALREPAAQLLRTSPNDQTAPAMAELQHAIAAASAGGTAAMASAGVSHILRSPRFYLVHYEPRAEGDTVLERRLLVATRLALVLWSSMPDIPLLTRAAAGELEDDEIYAAEIARLQADARFLRFSAEFARQWLRLDRAPQFRPDLLQHRLVEDPSRLEDAAGEAGEMLWDNFEQRLPVSDLLLGDRTLLRSHAVLSAISTPIKGGGDENWLGRGLLVQSAFLCRTFPLAAVYPSKSWQQHPLLDPTRDVPRPGEPELLAIRTRDEPCAECHLQLETIGAKLAGFDGFGNELSVPNGALDAESQRQISLERLGQANDLAKWVLQSGRFEPCVAQKVASYVLGRAVLPARRVLDRCLVTALARGRSEPKLVDWLEQLLHSPEFRRPGTEVVRDRPNPGPNSTAYREVVPLANVSAEQCADFSPVQLVVEQCGSSACHGAGGRAGAFALDSESRTVRALLAGKPRASGYCRDYPAYLDSAAPERSLIVQKLMGGEVCGAPMPLTGGPRSLGSVEHACLVRWFEELARSPR
jgi:Protein of unknown function (DUF1592)/Protein of unknown function (DUF1588)